MDRIIPKKRWTPKRIAALTLGGIFIATTSYALLLGDSGSKVRVSSERLTLSTVWDGEFQEFIPVNGTIVPIRTLYLDAIEGGRVEKRYLEAGSYVQEGDPILQLSNTNLLLDIMYREAELFQQSNNLRNTQLAMEQNSLTLQSILLELDYKLLTARRNFERSRQLMEKNLIASLEFEESGDRYNYLTSSRALTMQSHKQDSIFRTTQIKQLQTSLKRMEDNLKLVKQNQDNLLLRAPVSGHLTSLNAEIGESKVRGERLGQIDILDGFKARILIDEHYINRVRMGQNATVPLGAKSYQMTVVKIFPEVLNGEFQIEMVFDDDVPPDIRRGQAVRARLALGGLSKARLMARGSFFNKTGGQWVYVVEEDSKTASRRSIRLGRQNQDEYEILSGLEAGERVIVSSYDAFGEFDKVVLSD